MLKPKFLYSSHVPAIARVDEHNHRIFPKFGEYNSEFELKRSPLVKPHTKIKNFKRLSISKLEFNGNRLLIAEYKDNTHVVVGYVSTYRNYKLKFPIFEVK